MDEFNIKQDFTKGTKIKIIGVGGAGGNVLNDLISYNIENVKYTAINTDEQDLNKSNADEKISLGYLGAGANPEVARVGAENKKREIEDAVTGNDMIFITAGMGGGTGTGAAPIVAKLAKEKNILTVAIVTKPFKFEGQKRKINADEGINNLKEYVDTLIVIPNEKLLEFPEGESKPFAEHLKKSNEIIRFGIKGISELILKQGIINLDFADVETIMKNSGEALFGLAESEHEETVESLVEKTISNPLLERSIKGAEKILVNVIGGKNLSMKDNQKIVELISTKASGQIDGVSNLIFGMVDEPERENVVLTVIATGFNDGGVSTKYSSFDEESKTFKGSNDEFDFVPEF